MLICSSRFLATKCHRRGHFRLDQFGVNLNRAYENPSPKAQPAIFAIKQVLKQMAATLAPVVPKGSPSARSTGALVRGQLCAAPLSVAAALHAAHAMIWPSSTP